MTGAPPASAIGVDIGGTSVRGVLAGQEGLSATARLPTRDPSRTPLNSVFLVVESLLEQADEPVGSIGVATPGLVDGERGIVHFAANLGWRDLDLREILAQRYSIPVAIEHDARAAALAERIARGPVGTDMIFVPIGTGVSAALLTAGRPVAGSRFAAGEIGHVPVVPDGEPCACGQRGCVEAYVSAASILARYRRAGGRAESVPEIAVRIGLDPIAARIWGDAVNALGCVLAPLIAGLDPSAIVIGGGLSLAGERLFAPLHRRLSELLTWRTPPPISGSVLRDDGGVLGALALTMRHGATATALHQIHEALHPRTPTVGGALA